MARRAWAVLAVAVLACVHARHVGEDEGGAASEQRGAGEEAGKSPRATTRRIPPRGDRPAVAASPEGLMNPGSALKIQRALRDKGLLDSISGKLDEATSAALRRFQRREGLAETGAPDRETLRRLGVNANEVYATGTGDDKAAPPGR